MDRTNGMRPSYGGRAPYASPRQRPVPRREMPPAERYPRRPGQPRRDLRGGRPYMGARGRRPEEVETPPTIWDRLREPGYLSEQIPRAGAVTGILSIAFLVIFLIGGLEIAMVPIFALGAIGIVLTGIASIVVMFIGDDDAVNRAYLGLGLTIGSFILLGAGAVLAWR